MPRLTGYSKCHTSQIPLPQHCPGHATLTNLFHRLFSDLLFGGIQDIERPAVAVLHAVSDPGLELVGVIDFAYRIRSCLDSLILICVSVILADPPTGFSYTVFVGS